MFHLPSHIEKLNWSIAQERGIDVWIKRDDLIHPEISGNKWRKLKLNVEKAIQKKYDGILTFGGAYSNHIAATAAAGNLFQLKTIGVIRGEELNAQSNETLSKATENGMHLHFVSREQYAERYERPYHEDLRIQFGNVLIIEEGGANFHGMLGCVEIGNEVLKKGLNPDYVYVASGTGTTAAGLTIGFPNSKVVCVPVFKNGGFIRDEIHQLWRQLLLEPDEIDDMNERLILDLEAHFGGYGKWTSELIYFINEFYEDTAIALDQIYTAK